MNKDKYITKTDLEKRWSKSLIEKYFPISSMEKRNPYYTCAPKMQLYELRKVEEIEAKSSFRADFENVKKRKVSARKSVHKKYQSLVSYATSVDIEIPNFGKEELIRKACCHYDNRHPYNDLRACELCSDEDFMKRITTNYLRHVCTDYDSELSYFYGKVGVGEAHDILQKRINDAIREKYEWLR